MAAPTAARGRTTGAVRRLAVLVLACVTAACSAAAVPVDADGTYVLKAGHQLAPDTSFDVGLERFAELVAERTGGRVTVEVHPGAEVGGEADLFQGMRVGAFDVAVVAPNSIAEFVPELSLLSLPFLVTSREQRDAVIDGDVGRELTDLVAERMGVETLGFFGSGIRQMFFTAPVRDADDLRGRRIRLQPSRPLTDSYEAMGLVPALVDYGELYSALQQGVVDGAENESVFIEAETFYRPAPHLVVTNHEVTFRPLMASRASLDALPDDLATAVREAGAEAAAEASAYEAEEDDAALERLVAEHGMERAEIDVAPLVDAVEPVWQRYAQEWDATGLLEEILALRSEA